MSTEKIIKKRGARVTAYQKDFLADHMLKHTEFAAGRFVGPTGAEDARKMWEAVTNEANKLGPAKTMAQWQKTWKDMKGRSRGKAAAIRANFNVTGNFDDNTEPLTDTDKKVLSVIGSVAVEGLPGVADSLPESVADLRRLMAGDKTPLMRKPVQCPSIFEAFNIEVPIRTLQNNGTYTVIASGSQTDDLTQKHSATNNLCTKSTIRTPSPCIVSATNHLTTDTRPMSTHSADASPTDRHPTNSHPTHTAYTHDYNTNTHPTGSSTTYTLLQNTSPTEAQPTRTDPTHTAYTHDCTTNTHSTGSPITYVLSPNASPTDKQTTHPGTIHTAATHEIHAQSSREPIRRVTKRSTSDERAASFIEVQKEQNEILETMSQLLRVATTNEAAKIELKKQGLELKRRKVEAQEKLNEKIAELINVLINK